MSASPSYLYTVAGGCPARAANYRARRHAIPSDPMREGSIFHRIVEAIGRGMPVEDAVHDGAASARVAELVRVWAAEWHGQPCLGSELAIAMTDDGAICEWGAAWLRGIVDRIEMGDEPGVLVVTDWKSGWSGWTGIQAECYALLAAAWASDHGLAWERIVCRIWSPVARGFRGVGEWAADELPWETVIEHVAAARRLEARPDSEEVLGEGCARCDRRAECSAFATVHEAPAEDIEDAARVYLATRARVATLEARLREHCEATGEVVGGVGFAPSESLVMDGRAVLADVLAPWDVAEDAREVIAGMFNVSKTAAEKAARRLHPGRAREARDALMERWTLRRDVVPRWKAGGLEES